MSKSKPVKPKVSLGWCDNGMLHAEFFESVFDLYNTPKTNALLGPRIRVQTGANVSKARNELVRAFLDQTDIEWLWMLDTDLKFSAEALLELLRVSDKNERPIVSGLYYAAEVWETLPPGMTGLRPLLFDLHPEHVFIARREVQHNTVTQVGGAPTGCLLVHRSVYESTDTGKFPWFYEQIVNDQWVSEDLTFCLVATAAGYPIYTHTGVVCEHVKPTRLSSAMYAALGGPIQQPQEAQ